MELRLAASRRRLPLPDSQRCRVPSFRGLSTARRQALAGATGHDRVESHQHYHDSALIRIAAGTDLGSAEPAEPCWCRCSMQWILAPDAKVTRKG
jgi:hypothetical protein